MKWSISLALVVMLMPLPMVSAQSEPIMEDDSGDVDARTPAGSSPELAAHYSHLDLLSLALTEEEEFLTLTVELASLEPDPDAWWLDDNGMRVFFSYDSILYAVQVESWRSISGEAHRYARLVRLVEFDERFPDTVGGVGLEEDNAQNKLILHIHRDDIQNDNGVTPFKGRNITDIWAWTYTNDKISISGNSVADVSAEDRMPDEGAFPGYTFRLGNEQSLLAGLTSQEPLRMSNGGATTVVFQVEASNKDDRRHTFSLQAQGVPNGWQVSLPFDEFTLEPDTTRGFPILLVTESGHQHGGLQTFELLMKSLRDSRAFGELELGLRYTEIPQPAGHHPKLWFHSWDLNQDVFAELLPFFNWRFPAYMNAAEDDPSDAGTPVQSCCSMIPGFEQEFEWRVYLSPRLGIGLDFDLAGMVEVEVPIRFQYIMQQASMTGSLDLWDPAAERVVQLATGAPTTPVDFGPDATQSFQLALTPTKAADFVEYQSGMGLWLELTMTGTPISAGPFGPEPEPTLQPGGWMQMPLNEYRDPVSTFYRAVDSLAFAEDYLESQVNPGKTRIFEVALENLGESKDKLVLNVTGTKLEWVKILGDTRFDLPAGGSRNVAVAVTVPASIPDGVVVDLVVSAASVDNPFRRAVVDLIAVVDTEAEHPDDADRTGDLDKQLGKKDTPGFEIIAAVFGLLAVAAVWPPRRS